MTDEYKVQPCPSATNPQAVTVTTRTGEVKRFKNDEHAQNWITYTAGRRHRAVRR